MQMLPDMSLCLSHGSGPSSTKALLVLKLFCCITDTISTSDGEAAHATYKHSACVEGEPGPLKLPEKMA